MTTFVDKDFDLSFRLFFSPLEMLSPIGTFLSHSVVFESDIFGNWEYARYESS